MNGLFSGMTQPSAPSSRTAQSRQAALMLHAMEPADRTWLLGQLPQPERETLQALLKELDTLGIPPDPDCLDGLVALREAPRPAEPPVAVSASASESAQSHAATGARLSDGDAMMSLDAEKTARLARAWRAQPALLVAQALCLRPWPWRPALLEQLPAIQRRRVMDLLGTPGGCSRPGPALAAGLLQCMRQCCDAPSPPFPASSPAGGALEAAGARRWRQWLPRSLRMGKST